MKVFLTGATGYVGFHLAQDLLAHGHQVIGLARSDKSAEALKKQGAEVLRGDLTDLDVLKAGASAADAVGHLGYIHNFSKYGGEAMQVDLAAINAIAEVVKGTGKPFINTTTVGVAPLDGKLFTEDIPIADTEGHPAFPRIRAEVLLDQLTKDGVHGITVRLSPTVHGEGDQAFVAAIVGFARAKGVSPYIGEGMNTWPAVHVKDAATMYRLALEKKVPAGTKLHATQDEGIPFKVIAETVGKQLGVPAKSISASEAPAHFTWLTPFTIWNIRCSSKKTQELLGWKPAHTGLIEDLKRGHYFEEGAGTKLGL